MRWVDRLKGLWQRIIVFVFRTRSIPTVESEIPLNQSLQPLESSAEPTPVANLLAAGLAPPVEVELPVPASRRAKWVKPKGEKPKPIEREKPAEPRKPVIH